MDSQERLGGRSLRQGRCEFALTVGGDKLPSSLPEVGYPELPACRAALPPPGAELDAALAKPMAQPVYACACKAAPLTLYSVVQLLRAPSLWMLLRQHNLDAVCFDAAWRER